MKINILKVLFGWEKAYFRFHSSSFKNLTNFAFLISCRIVRLFKVLLLVSFFN